MTTVHTLSQTFYDPTKTLVECEITGDRSLQGLTE